MAGAHFLLADVQAIWSEYSDKAISSSPLNGTTWASAYAASHVKSLGTKHTHVAWPQEGYGILIRSQLWPQLAVECQGCVQDEQPLDLVFMLEGVQQTVLPQHIALQTRKQSCRQTSMHVDESPQVGCMFFACVSRLRALACVMWVTAPAGVLLIRLQMVTTAFGHSCMACCWGARHGYCRLLLLQVTHLHHHCKRLLDTHSIYKPSQPIQVGLRDRERKGQISA